MPRPIERQIALPSFIQRHATTMTLRTPYNPLNFAVYRRGNIVATRDASGALVEQARCASCREWKPAHHFPPVGNSTSGVRCDCYECYNAKRRTPHRREYMRDYMRKRRHYQRVGRGGARQG